MVKELLLVATGLFLAMLVFRFVRGVLQGRRLSVGRSCTPEEGDDPELKRMLAEAVDGPRAREALRRIEARAAAIDAPESRAVHHCAAAKVALTVLKRASVATKLYMRALQEDPRCGEALAKVEEILIAQRRTRRLERVCWEVLGRLDDGDTGGPIWSKSWAILAKLYAASPRLVGRADAIRKMLAAVQIDPDEALEDPPADLPRLAP